MTEPQHYQQSITDSIKELPLDALEEMADFVTFLQAKVRMRESDDALLLAELHLLSHQQQQHLEQEFVGYEQQFPKEYLVSLL